MTEVSFHVNAADKLGYACRLLRKAVGTGARVVVTGQQAQLGELDVMLWTFSPLDFIAHCRGASASPAVQSLTPVVLADSLQAVPHHQVLVNLGPSVPEGFERFERLIEVVGANEDDLQQGRRRWKHYKDRGYAVAKHELQEAA